MASSPDPQTLRRFSVTERVLHWAHATGFFAMLATGLILYLPALSTLVARRNLVKNLHIWAAVAWALAIVLVVLVGNRHALLASWREAERLDRNDRRWLRGRRVPQGRFNAGQKLNILVTAAFAVLFAVSGFFLWLGERDHRFLFAGTGTVHELPHARLRAARHGASLPRADPPDHTARLARDHHRRGARRLGEAPPPRVVRRAAPRYRTAEVGVRRTGEEPLASSA